MLAFYPEFEVSDISSVSAEYIIVIDASCSMEGEAFEDAKKLASLAILVHRSYSCRCTYLILDR